jgi:peptidoglycan/xylan/chitin deacetylase (PgdA/CDA1 family)
MRWYQHPPLIFSKLFPGLVWNIPGHERKVYLTFDDGPDPGTTPFLLETLAEKKVKATFFCIGRNIEKYSDLAESIRKEGHVMGNHGYSHLDGWKTGDKKYVQDVERARASIRSTLFRPPYGRIRPSQVQILKEKYEIMMWSWMVRDYTGELILQDLAAHYLKPGSIVLLHNNPKASMVMKQNILTLVEFCSKSGLDFSVLSEKP